MRRVRGLTAGTTNSQICESNTGRPITMPPITENLNSVMITSAGPNACSLMPWKYWFIIHLMMNCDGQKSSTESPPTIAIEISRRLRSSLRCSVKGISF